MSLYEYLLPVAVEDAEAYSKAIQRIQRNSSIFSQCCRGYGSDVCGSHQVIRGLSTKYNDWSEALELGRPWTGEGVEPEFYDLATSLVSYANHGTLDEELGGRLLAVTGQEDTTAWLRRNAGKTVILINDNEF